MQKINFDDQKGKYKLDVDSEDMEAEWKLFRQVIFTHLQRKLDISSIVKFSSIRQDTLDSTVHICIESPDLLVVIH